MEKKQLKYDFLLKKINVSHDTCKLFEIYYHTLLFWNQKFNLVSRKSIDMSWERHFLDSAQLWFFLPKKAKLWLDFGSGAGFPGLVIGVISKELKPNLKVVLVEKNKKKANFLNDIVNKIGLNVEIFSRDVKSIEPQRADVISSRAFGNLDQLLKISYLHKNKNTISLFPKGVNFLKEIESSKKNWNYDLEKIRNIIDYKSYILKIRNITFVHDKKDAK